MGGIISNNIITDGLVLYLDSSNPKSYIIGSTIWNDLSFNKNNGDLINGVSFSNNSMLFDGVNDYVDLSLLKITPSSFTIEGIFNITNYGSIFSKGFSTISDKTINLSFGQLSTNSLGIELSAGITSYPYFRSQQLITTGNTYYFSVTITTGLFGDYRDCIFFINGSYLVSSQTGFTSNSYSIGQNLKYNSNIPYNIGRSNAYNPPINYFNGSINFIRFYNRILSQNEIQQNYNATRKRFGL